MFGMLGPRRLATKAGNGRYGHEEEGGKVDAEEEDDETGSGGGEAGGAGDAAAKMLENPSTYNLKLVLAVPSLTNASVVN